MGKTVLIVEDDLLTLRLLEHQLADAGYDVITATNGDEGLHLIESHEPAMILTDWDMPEMSGLDLCRRLRSYRGYDWVYTIVVTAHGEAARAIEALDAGADDYLTKPFHKGELLARLRAGERIVDLERTLAGKNRIVVESKEKLESACRDLEVANRKLEQMACTDELTRLGNRRAAMSHLSDSWRDSTQSGRPMACFMLDVDHFKHVNDTHGHAVGDLALARIAEIMETATRTNESVFRLSGEEFLVVCTNATAAMCTNAAERLRAAVESLTITEGDLSLRVTASLGVAERSPEMTCADDLVRAADDALYDAKSSGRNCTRVAPTAPHAHPATRSDHENDGGSERGSERGPERGQASA